MPVPIAIPSNWTSKLVTDEDGGPPEFRSVKEIFVPSMTNLICAVIKKFIPEYDPIVIIRQRLCIFKPKEST